MNLIFKKLFFTLLFFTAGCDVKEKVDSSVESKNLEVTIEQSTIPDTVLEIEPNAEDKKINQAMTEIEEKILKLTTTAEDALKARLTDPDSIMIKNRIFSSSADKLINFNKNSENKEATPLWAAPFSYCLSYNAKNKFGGYTGYKTIVFRLYYFKDHLLTKDTQEILDYYIDALHFSMSNIANLTGTDDLSGCDIKSFSDSSKGITESVFNFLYADNL